jgi:predicted ATP-grasp superfamily ATP-dependent carboligase
LGYPNTEACIKPVHGTGNRGFHILRENHERFRSFFTEKPDNTLCGLDDLRAAMKAQQDSLPELIVAEYLSGQEYGIDLLAHEGKVVDFRIRKKLPPEKLGMHFLIKFVDEPALSTLIEELSAAMALSSLVSIDARRTASGTLCVLEVNPRPGAYIGMTCAEINLLAMAIDTLLSGSPPDTALYHTGQDVSYGIRCFHDMAFTNDSPRYAGHALPASDNNTPRAAPQSAEKGEA